VTCRDLPEAITQGESVSDALAEAADALEEAVASRIDDGREIPSPSTAKRGERFVSVPPSIALKAAVYLAVREAGISNSELARRLSVNEKEARRILDPHHPTKLPRIERVLSVLGRRLELSLA
jgi:antitoxin HicB